MKWRDRFATFFTTLFDQLPYSQVIKRRLYFGVRFIKHLVAEFFAAGCQKSAAALTYMTLFAIVPLMTVMYFMFSLVPAFENKGQEVQELIFSHIVPDSSHAVQDYLVSFSAQAKNLTVFGLGMLFVTAYLMLTNIEKSFNAIWGVTRARKGLTSFLIYWAVLTIGPLLLLFGIAVNAYILSLRIVFDEIDNLGIFVGLYSYIPFITASGAFTLLFFAVPNCRVSLRYAMIGGVLTAFFIELLKTIFTKLVANSSFELIYGAFAVVPLFLIWINLLWTVILSGAILVKVLSEYRFTFNKRRNLTIALALKCMRLFHECAQKGGRIWDQDCYKIGFGVSQWQGFRERLIQAKWIIGVGQGGYVLCRDLKSVDLWELADLIDMKLVSLADPLPGSVKQDAWLAGYLPRREELLSQCHSLLSVPVADIVCIEGGEELFEETGDNKADKDESNPEKLDNNL